MILPRLDNRRAINYTGRVKKTGRAAAPRKKSAGAAHAAQTSRHIDRRTTSLSILLLLGITVVCLAPFAGKAFNIDEPVFIWMAQHIQGNFADPYGSEVNWTTRTEPMWMANRNPPLASYYIALAAYIVGWSESGLHLAFIIPAFGVVLGTYFLARQLCMHPIMATLAAMLTPVFLISSNSVMCDTMMVAFWVWAVALWMQGMQKNSHAALAASAFLVAVCALTKYFGMNLIPLLLAYSVVRTRRIGWWALHLLIPVAILAGYEWTMHSLYGRGLILDACKYSAWLRSQSHAMFVPKCLAGLSFTGGCVATALFLAPVLWSRKTLVAGVALFVILARLMPYMETIRDFPLQQDGAVAWSAVTQLSLFVVIGISLLAVAIADLWNRRDADSVLLCLWVAGTFVFATQFNWSVNGRVVLPMVPAAGILLMRKAERRDQARPQYIICLLVAAGLLAMLATCSDYRFANTARKAAVEIAQRYGGEERTIWFQGHWGFHYYMESLGGKAVGYGESMPEVNDIVVIPWNNCLFIPPPPGVSAFDTIELASGWLGIMDLELGAGFYSDVWGPLPFAVGSVSPEHYEIFTE